MDEWFVVSTSEAEGLSYIWSSTSGTLHNTLKGNTGSTNGICVVGDATIISAQSARAALHVWTLTAEVPTQKSPVPEKMGPVVATGDYLFGGGKSGRLYVWALGSGALVNSVAAHYREITSLAVTGDGACVIR
jgi:WD40 repeat protein